MDYISVENQKLLGQRYKNTMLVILIMLTSIVIYLIIGRIIKPQEMFPGSETWQKPVYTTVIVAGLLVVVVRRLLMSRSVQGSAATRGVESALNNLHVLSVVCAVVAELIALAGLILYYLTGTYDYSWRLGVVGLFLVLYSFPRRGEWERAVVAAAGK